MISEQKFKENIINKLNPTLGWIDGDTEVSKNKKVDIVNHQQKIAIEVKDDTVHKPIRATPENPFVTSTTNLVKMNELLSDHIRKTRLKFKNYENYKTILIIRTEHDIMDTVRYAIDGLHTFTQTSYIGRRGKYTAHIRENIGCYIICDAQGDFHYIPNIHCKIPLNLVTKLEAERIFNQTIDEIGVV